VMMVLLLLAKFCLKEDDGVRKERGKGDGGVDTYGFLGVC